jgi:Protein of unknown function (DUF4241)
MLIRTTSNTILTIGFPRESVTVLTFVSLLLLACNQTAPDSEPAAPSPAAIRFTAEEPGNPDVGPVRLHVEAGKVSLPDGRLAVSDAFINDVPLIVSKLPGAEYNVEILVAQSANDQRVAAARVRLRSEPVASWRVAGGIAIDSGTAAFFDPRISATISPANVERFNDGLLKALEKSAHSTAISWEGMTFVAFSTGFGDGRYPVFVGSSAAGVPVVILVDCDILPWATLAAPRVQGGPHQNVRFLTKVRHDGSHVGS